MDNTIIYLTTEHILVLYSGLFGVTDQIAASALLNANMLVCSYLHDAQTQVKVHRTDGSLVRTVQLPGIGTARVYVFTNKWADAD